MPVEEQTNQAPQSPPKQDTVETSPGAVATSEAALNRTQQNQQTLTELTQQRSNLIRQYNPNTQGFDVYDTEAQKFLTPQETQGVDTNALKQGQVHDPRTGQVIYPGQQAQGQQPQEEPATPARRLTGGQRTPEEEELARLYEEATAQIEQYNQILDQRAAYLDDATQAQIANIKRTFELRRKQQEKVTQQTLGGLRVQGSRSGLTRYANEIQQGILTNAEREGLAALAELDAKEITLIREAQDANAEKQFDLLDKKMQAIEKLRDDKRSIITSMHDIAVAEEELAIRGEEFRYKRDLAISEMLAPSVYEGLTGDEVIDSENLRRIAAQNGITEGALLSKVIEYENDSITWETRTVSGRVVRFGFDRKGEMVARLDLGAAPSTGGGGGLDSISTPVQQFIAQNYDKLTPTELELALRARFPKLTDGDVRLAISAYEQSAQAAGELSADLSVEEVESIIEELRKQYEGATGVDDAIAAVNADDFTVDIGFPYKPTREEKDEIIEILQGFRGFWDTLTFWGNQ